MKLWNRIVFPAIVVAVGGGVIAALIGFKSAPTASNETPPIAKIEVEVKPATPEFAALSVSTQGNVKPKREIQLVSEVSGRVMDVAKSFDDGGFFKKGQVLVQLDDRDYRAELLNAQARVAMAKQALAEEQGRSKQARQEWRDIGSKEANDLFLRVPQLNAAKAEAASAQASLGVAQANLERTQIKAPFDGRIGKTVVDLGQYVTKGSPVADLFSTAVAEIRLPLTDKQVSMLDLPLMDTFEEAQARPLVTLHGQLGGKTYSWQGNLVRMDAMIDVNSRIHYGIVEVDSPFDLDVHAAPLLPGMFVTAEISGKARHDVIQLPRQAVIKRNKVLILDADNKVLETKATILKRDAKWVWVELDLPHDTAIVLNKHALISVGAEVAIAGEIPEADVNSQADVSPEAQASEQSLSRNETEG